MGKVSFAHIEDGAGKIQLFFRINEVGKERLDFFNKMFDLGDFIQADGRDVPHQDRRGRRFMSTTSSCWPNPSALSPLTRM